LRPADLWLVFVFQPDAAHRHDGHGAVPDRLRAGGNIAGVHEVLDAEFRRFSPATTCIAIGTFSRTSLRRCAVTIFVVVTAARELDDASAGCCSLASAGQATAPALVIAKPGIEPRILQYYPVNIVSPRQFILNKS
jgi:hypothetical protein